MTEWDPVYKPVRVVIPDPPPVDYVGGEEAEELKRKIRYVKQDPVPKCCATCCCYDPEDMTCRIRQEDKHVLFSVRPQGICDLYEVNTFLTEGD